MKAGMVINVLLLFAPLPGRNPQKMLEDDLAFYLHYKLPSKLPDGRNLHYSHKRCLSLLGMFLLFLSVLQPPPELAILQTRGQLVRPSSAQQFLLDTYLSLFLD